MRAIALIGLAAVVGCGGDGKVTVSGRVAFNGKPVDGGSIQFHAADGSGIDGGKIKDGKYEVRTAPGAKRVAVVGERVTGVTKHDVGVRVDVFEDKENYVPPEFNDKTTLTYTVEGGGTKDFDLTGDDLIEKRKKK